MRYLHFAIINLVVLSLFSMSGELLAEDRTFGFQVFTERPSLIAGTSPLEIVLRNLTTRSLVRRRESGAGASFQLDLAASIQIDDSTGIVSVTLDKNAEFEPGHRVQANDVFDSLRKCAEFAVLKVASAVGTASDQGIFADTIQLQLQQSLVGIDTVPTEVLFHQLSKCPVFDSASLQIFGDDLGYGTNIVSAGSFLPSDFRPGRMLRLRSKSGGERKLVNSDLVLKEYENEQSTLSALRIGNIQAYFARDVLSIEAAVKDDPTLSFQQCQDFVIVSRKSLGIDCDLQL